MSTDQSCRRQTSLIWGLRSNQLHFTGCRFFSVTSTPRLLNVSSDTSHCFISGKFLDHGARFRREKA